MFLLAQTGTRYNAFESILQGPHWAVRQYLGSNRVGCVSFRGLAQIPSTALSLNFLVWPGLETIEVGDTTLVVVRFRNSGLIARRIAPMIAEIYWMKSRIAQLRFDSSHLPLPAKRSDSKSVFCD